MKYLITRFINSEGFVSEMIDWSTNSLFDHVEIADTDGSSPAAPTLGWIGAHAKGGVERRAPDYCTPKRERRYALPVTDSQFTRVMQSAKRKIGTPYNFRDIVGLMFHNRHVNATHVDICSQFVDEVFNDGGIWLLNVETAFAYLVTPETLHLSPLWMGHCTLKIEDGKQAAL